jgi:hypothetical protein
VPKLTTKAVGSTVQFAPKNKTSPNAGAQNDCKNTLMACAGAIMGLRQGEAVSIIGQHNGPTKCLAHIDRKWLAI